MARGKNSGGLKALKNKTKIIAQHLQYPQKALEDIDKARTEEEIDRVMRSARKGEYDEKE